MTKKEIKINKGQYLSDIYSIESNTILCKTLTGLGATYTEIKAKRNSIIVEPNVPPIIGKCNDKKHKKDNLFAVKNMSTFQVLQNTYLKLSSKRSTSRLSAHQRASTIR